MGWKAFTHSITAHPPSIQSDVMVIPNICHSHHNCWAGSVKKLAKCKFFNWMRKIASWICHRAGNPNRRDQFNLELCSPHSGWWQDQRQFSKVDRQTASQAWWLWSPLASWHSWSSLLGSTWAGNTFLLWWEWHLPTAGGADGRRGVFWWRSPWRSKVESDAQFRLQRGGGAEKSLDLAESWRRASCSLAWRGGPRKPGCLSRVGWRLILWWKHKGEGVWGEGQDLGQADQERPRGSPSTRPIQPPSLVLAPER